MTFKQVFGTLIGLVIMGGSAASWHFWGIDGAVACWIAFGGMALIGGSLGMKDLL